MKTSAVKPRINPYLIWGTRGKDGKQPVKQVQLKDCETDHLQNILKTEIAFLRQEYIDTINYLLKKREGANVSFMPMEDLPLLINEDFLSEEDVKILKQRLAEGA